MKQELEVKVKCPIASEPCSSILLSPYCFTQDYLKCKVYRDKLKQIEVLGEACY